MRSKAATHPSPAVTPSLAREGFYLIRHAPRATFSKEKAERVYVGTVVLEADKRHF
ncbi:MAG: hypothetical protein IKL79_05355 [Clostridia bacterium]|nr:hypothetical protein [Clostridia bacterium]MBR3681411.1 hypothetical protein [Clostridia bacterium]